MLNVALLCKDKVSVAEFFTFSLAVGTDVYSVLTVMSLPWVRKADVITTVDVISLEKRELCMAKVEEFGECEVREEERLPSGGNGIRIAVALLPSVKLADYCRGQRFRSVLFRNATGGFCGVPMYHGQALRSIGCNNGAATAKCLCRGDVRPLTF